MNGTTVRTDEAPHRTGAGRGPEVLVVHQLDTVAIIIDPVALNFRCPGIHRGVGVVAVGDVRVAIAIAVRQRAVRAVAVLVDAVRHNFRGAGVHRRIRVVAVRAVAHGADRLITGVFRRHHVTIAVAVHVGVPRAFARGSAFVDVPVAIIVDAVAGLDDAGADTRIRVVAVRTAVDDVVVPIAIRIRIGEVASVTVLVDAVRHDLRGAGIRRGVPVIAVRTVGDEADRLIARALEARHIAVAVAVHVGVPRAFARGSAFVNRAVTVVIHTVAPLDGTGVDSGIRVVAVRAIADPRGIGRLTVLRFGRHVAVPVAVHVLVEVEQPGRIHARIRVVHETVAVLVHGASIAQLRLARIHIGASVVAIRVVRHVPGRGRTRNVGHRCIAVAVTVAVGVPDERVRSIVVDGFVAVVVDTIARFRVTGIRGRIDVVAILAGDRSIAVQIRRADGAIAVEIDGVRAIFNGIRINGRVAIVAVRPVENGTRNRVARQHAEGDIAVAIAVGIDVVRRPIRGIIVDDAVAVVVDVVAHFHGIGVDSGIRIVAVDVGREAVAVHIDDVRGVAGVAGVRRVRGVGIRVAGFDDSGVGRIRSIAGVGGVRNRIAVTARIRVGAVDGSGVARVAGVDDQGAIAADALRHDGHASVVVALRALADGIRTAEGNEKRENEGAVHGNSEREGFRNVRPGGLMTVCHSPT